MNLLDFLPAWAALAHEDLALELGPRVEDVIARARDLRGRLRTGEAIGLPLEQPAQSADALYAVCALLFDDCETAPRDTLEAAAELESLLDSCKWRDDDLDERGELLGTLAFICWRSARIGGLTREAQRWESRSRRLFRGSLRSKIVADRLTSTGWSSPYVVSLGPEAIFQTLLFLSDSLEISPQRVSVSAEDLYRCLESTADPLPVDLRQFFLAESARVKASAIRFVGHPREIGPWILKAESLARGDVDSRPLHARLDFLRLLIFFHQDQHSAVVRGTSDLATTFDDLGMEEDRIKCILLRTQSLKFRGDFDGAEEALASLRRIPDVRASLRGFILALSGDLHVICGDYTLALSELKEAESLLRQEQQFMGLASVAGMFASLYRAHGRFRESLALLEQGRRGFAELGVASLEASTRLLAAETYLAMGSYCEAEIEVAEALPVLQSIGAVGEAVAAVNLLAEIRRRRRIEREDAIRREGILPKP